MRRLVPDGADVFDAHVHVGRDIDGFVAPLDDLLRLSGWSPQGAFAFCSTSPIAIRRSGPRTTGRSRPPSARTGCSSFVRLDLSEEPVAEAERCLDRGARGIKLHPRAQKFRLNDERLEPIFRIAAERRVWILIHGARPAPDRRRARPPDRAPPRGAAHHRAPRDRGSRVALGDLRGPGGRLLRHLRLEPRRPPRRLQPHSAGASACLRLPVRPAAELARQHAPRGTERRFTEERLRDLLGRTALRIRDGDPRSSRPHRSAAGRSSSR